MGFIIRGSTGGSGGDSGDSNALAGVENHIAKGLKITGTICFNVEISAGGIVAIEIS